MAGEESEWSSFEMQAVFVSICKCTRVIVLYCCQMAVSPVCIIVWLKCCCCVVCSSTPPMPIRVEDFIDHVIGMHRDSDYQFSHEYSVCTMNMYYVLVFILHLNLFTTIANILLAFSDTLISTCLCMLAWSINSFFTILVKLNSALILQRTRED